MNQTNIDTGWPEHPQRGLFRQRGGQGRPRDLDYFLTFIDDIPYFSVDLMLFSSLSREALALANGYILPFP
jgi:hypothetical protein